MSTDDFVSGLKTKRDYHLAEAKRLQTESDRHRQMFLSLHEYVRSSSNGHEAGKASSTIPRGSAHGTPLNVAKLNLTEAIIAVMGTRPDYGWRGMEITKLLKEEGFSLNNLPQRVAARLVERSRSSKCEIGRVSKSPPRYKLRGNK